jgi:hypothetical protein
MQRGSWRYVRRLGRRLVGITVVLLAVYLLAAYVVVPACWWHVEGHRPALEGTPTRTQTRDGIPGDPVNIALMGTEDELTSSMLAAGWYPADPITLASALRIAESTVLRQPYPHAPVSNLYLWGRKEDLAFELPAGHDACRRHHVRFWRSDRVDQSGRPVWIGAATFDTSVGFSHTTGQITHHIGPDVDAERDKLLADLRAASRLIRTDWIDDFQPQRQGRNGGGDPYDTDGRLAVGVLAPKGALGRFTPVPSED